MQGFKIVAGQDDAEYDIAVLVDQGEAANYLDGHNSKLWRSLLDQSEAIPDLPGDLDYYKQLDSYINGLSGLEHLRTLTWAESEYRQKRARIQPITVYLPGEWVA